MLDPPRCVVYVDAMLEDLLLADAHRGKVLDAMGVLETLRQHVLAAAADARQSAHALDGEARQAQRRSHELLDEARRLAARADRLIAEARAIHGELTPAP
jgi:hypothetical protein